MLDKNGFRLEPECIICLANKYFNKLPCEMDKETKSDYFQKVLNLISNAPLSTTPPEIVAEIQKLQLDMFGVEEDFSYVKKYYNSLLLGKEQSLMQNIENADDGLLLAVCYAVLGNYIDFGTSESVKEEKLNEILETAKELTLNISELSNMKNDLHKAEKLVYITDNCGEIVLDKLLMKIILKKYPHLSINIVVRGDNVLNDATVDDALQVGLDKIAPIFSNGSNIAGTSLEKISAKSREIIDSADVIIAKGQANFETMRYCGKNVYYLFMCKCKMFSERFNVKQFSPMIINDLRMD